MFYTELCSILKGRGRFTKSFSRQPYIGAEKITFRPKRVIYELIFESLQFFIEHF